MLGIGSETVVLENKTCNYENHEVIEVVSAIPTCAAALESPSLPSPGPVFLFLTNITHHVSEVIYTS